MCIRCELYGNGMVWYKNPKNHARRIYKNKAKVSIPTNKTEGLTQADAAIEEGLVADLVKYKYEDPQRYEEGMKLMDQILADALGCQVIPLQDAFEVLDIATPVAILPCSCRRTTRATNENTKESFSCMGLGLGMTKWERWPERYHGALEAGGVEFLSPSQAKEWVKSWNEKGMVQIVMNEGGPGIGGLCNCDYPDCLVIRWRLDYGLKGALLKAHFIAHVNYDRCNGCGICFGRCQFGALRYEVTTGKVNIDPFLCFGCGLCETVCSRRAIYMADRESFPALKEVW